MSGIKFSAETNEIVSWITNVPGFEGDRFKLTVPEAIGSVENGQWPNTIKCNFKQINDKKWKETGSVEGELEYSIDILIKDDYVDFIHKLTNKSKKVWNETFVFNCFDMKLAATIRDHGATRNWTRSNNEFKRLTELPRVFGTRPTLQLYSVEGRMKGKDIPFVNNFKSTPHDVAIEGWFAIQSKDGKRLVAAVSKPALFTFQNREYSCISSSPSFGKLKPNETGNAFVRLYFVESSLEDWYIRMVSEFKEIDPAKM